ncbi:Na+/H+ antiporter subunit E [Pseudomonas sp. MYb185]|uniref:Na+/H+ antiporter subunit E n=1 Tax=Pseudomonas sp. MYb185 TaxID=1848729 RepID=UPI000CFBC3EC|nr:Na+/H+ antiporter subunit E [Pseudomonas sp. MYb185]PRB79978.1 Na+/H+ antiporter subunit E [Pseudomonas sp. MYb185]
MVSRRRWLPHPWLSLLLLIIWQLLVNQLSLGSLLLGLLLALLIPQLTRLFWPNPPTLYRPGVLAGFMLRVLGDIVIANFQVARMVLGPNARLRPAFVVYPLELRDEFAISVLANTISLTPGTVSADISDDHRSLLIHGLDVPDAQELIDVIKQRYEKPLMEIFECSRT